MSFSAVRVKMPRFNAKSHNFIHRLNTDLQRAYTLPTIPRLKRETVATLEARPQTSTAERTLFGTGLLYL